MQKLRTHPRPSHRVLVKSQPVSILSSLDLIRGLNSSVANSKVGIKENIRFMNREHMVDTTTSFTGACLQPISLKNFSVESDHLVALVRYSSLNEAPADLADELGRSFGEVSHWISHGCSLTCTISFEAFGVPFVGIEGSDVSENWKVYTHPYNESIRRGEVSATAQKERFDEVIRCLGMPFGQREHSLEIVDGFLNYEAVPNARVISRDPNLGFGDARFHKRLEMEVHRDESALLVDGMRSLVNRLGIVGRGVARIGFDRAHYESWRENFQHREAFYEYLYQGVLVDEVIRFLTGQRAMPPSGFVPYAQYWLSGQGAGEVSLSFEFTDDTVRFWLSGGERVPEERMRLFLEQTDLAQYTDSSCVVFH